MVYTLDRLAVYIGVSSGALEDHIEAYSGDWVDFQADDLFYNVKGQTYGYLMILEGLGSDFDSVIQNRELQVLYANMLDSFRLLAALDPLFVSNNELDDQFMPNHLAAQGFYLMRARTQLREITNILLK